MFENVTGSFTAVDSTGITVDISTTATDALKSWRCTTLISATYTEFEITSNSQVKIFFINSLVGTGTFTAAFITRAFLEEFESDMESVGKVPASLIDKKIEVTRKHFTEKIKSQFRYLYSDYPNETDPFTRIINLNEVQVAFAYYIIYEIYSDLSIEEGDNSDHKSRKYLSRYKDIMKESLSLLSVDTDSDSAISNSEAALSKNQGNILVR